MNAYTRGVSSPAVPDLVGEVLDGRYEVLEHLADGGMAIVYRALDLRLHREVALKVLRPHLVHDDEFVRRFEREARSAAGLQHPHIVGVLDYGSDNGHLFIAMEYVAGRTLRQVLEDEGSLTPRAALDILDPTLDALADHLAHVMNLDLATTPSPSTPTASRVQPGPSRSEVHSLSDEEAEAMLLAELDGSHDT